MMGIWYYAVCLLVLCINKSVCAESVLKTGVTPYPVHIDDSVKGAYVFMHYEGTERDPEYVLGLRVLIKSVRDTGTKYPMIVLVATNVSPESREAFAELGAEVREVENIPNPYKEAMQARRTYKDRFEFTFNKLYLWDLTEFDRVIYMDSDNVVLYNIDELFLCGHFCVVFMNMIHFHTGMLVVKPDKEEYNNLLKSLQSMDTFSYDGADQGFLTAHFPDMENTPLFRAEEITDGLPFEDKGMRVGMEYNLNHLYYYLIYNYDWLRPMGHYFSDYEIPALSMCFPIAPIMKPWYWLPSFFFDGAWTWHRFRSTLPGEEYWYNEWLGSRITSAIAMSIAAYIYVKIVLPHRALYEVRRKTVALMMRLPMRVVKSLAIVLGTVICYYVAPAYASDFVPQLVPPDIAWLVWMPTRMGIIYIALETCATFTTSPMGAGYVNQPLGIMYALRPPWSPKSLLLPFVIETIALQVGVGRLFPSGMWSFVVKLLGVILFFFISVCIEIQMFQVTFEMGYRSQKTSNDSGALTKQKSNPGDSNPPIVDVPDLSKLISAEEGHKGLISRAGAEDGI